jgi:hypothetical protein
MGEWGMREWGSGCRLSSLSLRGPSRGRSNLSASTRRLGDCFVGDGRRPSEWERLSILSFFTTEDTEGHGGCWRGARGTGIPGVMGVR